LRAAFRIEVKRKQRRSAARRRYEISAELSGVDADV
jgi:hypothetical protein